MVQPGGAVALSSGQIDHPNAIDPLLRLSLHCEVEVAAGAIFVPDPDPAISMLLFLAIQFPRQRNIGECRKPVIFGQLLRLGYAIESDKRVEAL